MFMGMWHAQIISAIAQLGVPDKLAGGAASAGDLARGRERTAGEYTCDSLTRRLVGEGFRLVPLPSRRRDFLGPPAVGANADLARPGGMQRERSVQNDGRWPGMVLSGPSGR